VGFASLDDLINEMTTNGKRYRADFNKTIANGAYAAGAWYDLSLLSGSPVANTYAGTGLTSTVPTETTGWGIYHGGNVSTDTKHLLKAVAYANTATTAPGTLLLVDTLIYYNTILSTSSSPQGLTNSTSLTRYTNGNGNRAYFVHTVASGANTPTVAMSYTRQTTGGTDTGRALGATTAFVASVGIGRFPHSGTSANNRGPFLPLQSGDTGIKSIESVTVTTPHASTGTMVAVICQPLAEIPLTTANVPVVMDFLSAVPSLPQIQDGACLNLLYNPAGAAANGGIVAGSLEFAWG
jgi:hypothetical protein